MRNLPPPEVAVGGVCVRDGLLLLVRRGAGAATGRWSVPGGRVELGESLVDAVRREMAEETGLAVEVGPLCGIAEHLSDEHHYVIIDFWVSACGDAAAGGDAADLQWVGRSRLAELDLVDGLTGFLAEHGVADLLR